jgi:hypothetical protein
MYSLRMRSVVQLLAVIAAVSAAGVTQAQEWPRYHVGGATALKATQLGIDLSEAGGIPARIWGETTLDDDWPWKLAVGFRPVRVVGVEIQYLDLGEGVRNLRGGGGGQVPQQYAKIIASSHATVVSALLFIPERRPTADFYGKIGIAALDEALRVSGYDSIAPGCQPACAFGISVEKSESVPYVGFGARFKLGAATGIRLEFDAVDRDGGDPLRFLSLGLAWER